MIRSIRLSLLCLCLCAPAALGQATLPADDTEPDITAKELSRIIRQTLQAQARAEAGNRQQWAEYHRKADAQEQEQRREYEDAQGRSAWIYLVLFIFLVVISIWGVFAVRKTYRKQDAAVLAVEATRAQNERIIEALYAIGGKLDELKGLLNKSSQN